MTDRILVAMSGGVDSSVAAYLIKGQGYEAVGVTLKLFSNDDIDLDADSACCSLSDVEDARSVAVGLGIDHHVFNFGEHFREHVIDRFVATYESGGTPNPCIDCNRFIKWKRLLERAELLECSKLATGHYARTVYDSNTGRTLLMRAADPSKDQTYVLYSLTKEQLSRTILPLGQLTKAEVREIAEANGFVNSGKPDSQDICFVPNGDYAGFIEKYTGRPSIPGDFMDDNGKVVGRHKGIIHYTVGQRKGLGVSMGRPIFVSNIDPVSRVITLSDEPALFSRVLHARDVNLTAIDRIDTPLRVTAKIRYAHKESPATVIQTAEDEIMVTFDEPQRAITRGQAVVLYDGDVVIGGATIV